MPFLYLDLLSIHLLLLTALGMENNAIFHIIAEI
jgi:hypothetical protein